MINSESSLNTNTIYKYYSANDSSQKYVDGFENFLFYTKTKNENKALLESVFRYPLTSDQITVSPHVFNSTF